MTPTHVPTPMHGIHMPETPMLLEDIHLLNPNNNHLIHLHNNHRINLDHQLVQEDIPMNPKIVPEMHFLEIVLLLKLMHMVGLVIHMVRHHQMILIDIMNIKNKLKGMKKMSK